ncbi:hypothetical protein L7F22_015427 [Adiantum nelumboides]|nr:hypothetical protein [Adiantum nelumboides]
MVRGLTSIPCMGARFPAPMLGSMFQPPHHTFNATFPSPTPPPRAPLQHSTPDRPRLASMPILTDVSIAREGGSTSSSTQRASRVNGRLSEVIILIESKKAFDVLQEEGGIYVRSRDRWLTIAGACRLRGVHRSKSQWKMKWERMHTLFTRVRDYEKRIPLGQNSY